MMHMPPSDESTMPQPFAGQDDFSPYAQALREHFPTREEILREAKQQSQRQRRLKKVTAGAAWCLLVALSWYIDPVLQSESLQTAVGQQANFVLKDGSQVKLNTNSLLIVEQHLYSRQLTLQQGEALFRVEHGWRPFTVYANQTAIRDIGTVFNVRNTAHGAEVTVLEGAVEVSTGSSQQLLTRNQALRSEGGSLSAVKQTSAESATAWQQGRLMFDAKPLSEVVAELQRYHVGQIEIADSRVSDYPLSGEYDIHGIDALIDVLPEILPVRIERRADQSIVIRHRS
jgi:transmembrane sensor